MYFAMSPKGHYSIDSENGTYLKIISFVKISTKLIELQGTFFEKKHWEFNVWSLFNTLTHNARWLYNGF